MPAVRNSVMHATEKRYFVARSLIKNPTAPGGWARHAAFKKIIKSLPDDPIH